MARKEIIPFGVDLNKLPPRKESLAIIPIERDFTSRCHSSKANSHSATKKELWASLLCSCLSANASSSSSSSRGGVPNLSVSGDNFDLVEVDPHDLTTTSEPEAPMQSLNQLLLVTNLAGARSAWSRRSIPARNWRTNKKKTRAILLSLEGGVLNYTRHRRLARVQE
jgi:hypothetical protein